MTDHHLFAATYDASMRAVERAGLAERRRRLLASAHGRVLEVGAGTGLNLAHYPAEVERLVVVEPDSAMARRLARRIAGAAMPVEVHRVPLADAPLADASFDTVVATLVLCSVADVGATLASIARLLVPGGSLLFLEHVRATGLRGRVQHAAAPVWRRLAGGCRPDRDTPAALRAAGFVISDIDRFRLRRAGPLVATAVQGVAWPRAHAALAGLPS